LCGFFMNSNSLILPSFCEVIEKYS
jgi:hypothetical protein